MQDYQKRLKIPLQGSESIEFKTASGVLVARGYARVVIGQRGPYVEFTNEQLAQEAFFPATAEHHYYREYRIKPDNVKVYHQVHRVDYADYLPGMYYISPFELYVNGSKAIRELKEEVNLPMKKLFG